MTQDQIDEISTEVGCIEKKLTQITNPQFGFLGDESRYDELYDFVKKMLTNLLHDAKARKIDIVYDGDILLAELERNSEAFSEIEEATLVHWDLWEGNVFIKDGDVSGIIDWERAMWGEALMDDRFRHHNKNDAFLIGFGKESFTEKEKIRLRWYDIILYLTMMIEVFYREFEDKGQYDWARGMLVEVY
jgi:aminoglycoside phosphotransferase